MRISTRIRSRVATSLASAGFQRIQQRFGRMRRRLSGEPPTVHYFHEITDPYSHLAVQRLAALAARYSVRFLPHLVSSASDDFRGDAERFDAWAFADATAVAPCYGVEAPGSPASAPGFAYRLAAGLQPAAHAAASGEHTAVSRFAEAAHEAGRAYWSRAGDARGSGQDVERAEASADGPAADDPFAAGNALRTRLGHYQGAMFHFDGEWFWGLDRLYLLEARLLAEGFSRSPDAPLVVPRPEIRIPTDLDASSVHLEVFPSLRSPYTAIGFPSVLELIDATGVAAALRPVMPMMMRGVAAPRAKQRWIITDAGREGRTSGHPLGRIVDPLGDPVREAFALWSAIVDAGAERAFLAAYLDAAWMDGVDVAEAEGLDLVLRRAGLEPAPVRAQADADRSAALLDANIADMLDAGLWGVPSFRVSGGVGDTAPFVCWGQDRIWCVAAEIVTRAGGDPGVAMPVAKAGP